MRIDNLTPCDNCRTSPQSCEDSQILEQRPCCDDCKHKRITYAGPGYQGPVTVSEGEPITVDLTHPDVTRRRYV
jgi:hypothetical protein